MPPATEPRDRDAITFLEFSLTAPAHPFVAASIDGGRVVLEELVPRGDARYAEYLTIVGVRPEEVLTRFDGRESVVVDLLYRDGDGGLFELLVDERCPVVFLCTIGAVPRQVESTDGVGRITTEVPASEDAATIVDRFLSANSDAELVIKRPEPYRVPRFDLPRSRFDVGELLTDRQRGVLAAAYEGGSYEWPRETTGEELAATIGISPSTLHQHLRAAHRHLVERYLRDLATRESHEGNRQTLLEQ